APARGHLVVVVGGCSCLAGAPPPAGETAGPLGALFLARALARLGIRIVLATDAFCLRALAAGLQACGLEQQVPLIQLPPAPPTQGQGWEEDALAYWSDFVSLVGMPSHLIALERV